MQTLKDERTTATVNAADQLLNAIERAGSPVCVGLDPVFARLPVVLRSGVGERTPEALSAIRTFSLGVLVAIARSVPCVKFQSACYERYGHAGVALLEEMIAAARGLGLIVILDAKRGDIGISSEHYAEAAFGGADAADSGQAAPDGNSDSPRGPNWLTINAYLGEDGILPFLARGGAFALVRTSNPGGDAIQSCRLVDGRTVAECVAEVVAAIGRDFIGERGYSALGAVVGATNPADAERLRSLMPEQIFLVPGFGAQGGGVDDIRPCFDAKGRGAIVTASRSIIYADQTPEGAAEDDWTRAVGKAAAQFAATIGHAVGMK